MLFNNKAINMFVSLVLTTWRMFWTINDNPHRCFHCSVPSPAPPEWQKNEEIQTGSRWNWIWRFDSDVVSVWRSSSSSVAEPCPVHYLVPGDSSWGQTNCPPTPGRSFHSSSSFCVCILGSSLSVCSNCYL